VTDTARRGALAKAATDYTLRHGLIGLSLRPLAAELGTSDRMLLYHFRGKDDLVATILQEASDRSVAAVAALATAPDVRTAVHELWAASTSGELVDCQRVYVQAAALGLLGQEPYASVVHGANERWSAAVRRYLEAAGCPPERSRRAVNLLDAAFTGLQLDSPLDAPSRDQALAVEDVAVAVAQLAAQPGSA
jgi:AcrR family transcriptional regulator